MLRPQAVLTTLVEEVGGLRAQAEENLLELLERARRRAIVVVCVDWAAILVLVLGRGASTSLVLNASEETIFTLGLLAIAVHSGFRLGQLEKLGAIRRAAEEIPD